MKIVKKIQPFIEIGIIITLLSLIIFYTLGYTLVNDGFQKMEIAIYSILSPTCYFFVTLVVGIILLTKYQKMSIKAGEKIAKWYIQLLVIFLVTFGASVILDGLYFLLIDKTLSIEYAEGLLNMIQDKPEQMKALETFANLPPFLQNYILHSIAILTSILICLPVSKAMSKPPQLENSLS